MRKILLLAVIFSCTLLIPVQADPPTDPPKDPPSKGATSEGMWLPIDLNYEHMQALGLELTEEEIYSDEKPSIKDAIVQMGGFCTGEIISGEGLMLTNHHCGYDAIASQSTVENDYLSDGFWAMKNSEELPIEGLTVSFLVRMEDVTERVLGPDRDETDMLTIQSRIGEIESEAGADNEYKTEVKDVFHGAEYYLYVYEVFRDVRLVGAPPRFYREIWRRYRQLDVAPPHRRLLPLPGICKCRKQAGRLRGRQCPLQAQILFANFPQRG